MFKITINNETKFYTAINKDAYAWYDVEKSEIYGKDVWNYCYRYRYSIEGNEKFILKDIYEEFSKRDIKIKCNVYKKDVDKTEYFEFVGDPFYLSGKEKAKNKQLILYRPSSKSF